MDRSTITVYANNGMEIGRYPSVTDVRYPPNRPNTVLFADDSGCAVVITGGIIIEETE